MTIQHQRVVELCNELRLGGVAAQYTALAQKAAEKHTSFTCLWRIAKSGREHFSSAIL
jgi:copper homeostasis protein CutC